MGVISGLQTCLDKKEFLGFRTHHIGRCAVVTAKVVLRIRGNLKDKERQKNEKYQVMSQVFGCEQKKERKKESDYMHDKLKHSVDH